MLPILKVIYSKGYQCEMLSIQNITDTKCYLAYAKCYLYEMHPLQTVLYEMLLYENVPDKTLLILYL